MERKAIETPDLREKGGAKNGQPQFLDRRLYMQLMVFGRCPQIDPMTQCLEKANINAVVYHDAHDPQGVGLLVMHEDPSHFVTDLRQTLQQEPFASLETKAQYTMFGRTYAVGYEPDLEDSLIHKPRRTALNAQWPWAVWYPLRRNGAFAMLPPDQQRTILGEHGTIGRSFGQADLAHDVRLACHGMDTFDNDFVIGLVGADLQPLSAVVQTMRKTTQTAQYIEKLGPFFVGKAVWHGST